MTAHIYQIFYDNATERQLDRGFIPLANPGNPRADWREYWPIRNFLLDNALNEDDCYGFFSPAFGNKSRLSSAKVFEFIRANPGQDVYSFSPLRQDSLCYLNIFEHGNRFHPGMIKVITTFFDEIQLSVDLASLVMDLQTTIFCNYLVAKPAFWQKWFALTEKIFDIAENETTPLSRSLNDQTMYRYRNKSTVSMKVFIMERLASLVVSLDPELSVRAYDIEQMPWSEITYYPYRDELMTLNALKLAYLRAGNQTYLRLFFEARNRILEKCDPIYPQERKNHFFD